MKNRGFTLIETLLAMMIGGLLMLGAARTLPLLQQQNLRLQMRVLLNEELQQMMQTLEKAMRRAGYCHGRCTGSGLRIVGPTGGCLLLRWDENSQGSWGRSGQDAGDYYGFRLRGSNLEMQRGVDRCDGSGWEKLNDPQRIAIEHFEVNRHEQRVRVALAAHASGWPAVSQEIVHWVTAENL